MRLQRSTQPSLKVGLLTAALTITMAATNAFGISLELIPTLTGDTANQAFAMTSDGKYVVGQSTLGTSSLRGFIYNVASASVYNVFNGAQQFTTANGVGYRNNNTEVIISGFSAGWPSEFMTTDGGMTFGAIRRTSAGNTIMGSYNQLGAPGGSSDLYYYATRDVNNGTALEIRQGSGPWPATITVSPKSVGSQPARLFGMSATGRAVGRRVLTAGTARNYFLDYNGTSGGGGWTFNALNTVVTDQGEAWAVSGNGLYVGGASGVGTETGIMYPYLAKFASGVYTGGSTWLRTDPLPLLGDASLYTSTTKGWVYGINSDGGWTAGYSYPGANHAMLWDTRSSNPAEWVAIDLTAYAQARGILGNWTRLDKAFSVGVDPATGDPIVSGIGIYGGVTRAFVMQIPEPSSVVLGGLGVAALLAFRRRK